ncbi:hypothetical protein H0H81_011056 [Sphagnurus paluster]|uniref:Uncharacterized protein n=1 Tax=Sphagnurus paluster TaxID=117069 RepID=A0A9P7FWX4_9AGAR|nr:hypothetical protein H0H81_011056 [Sphagnurus paluster]
MKTDAGTSLLERIFLQNRTTSNYITVLLGRSDDPTDFYSGSLTISEVLEGFEGVLNQPKLPIVNVEDQQINNQHFQVLLDQNGIIGPDGKAISITTGVKPTFQPFSYDRGLSPNYDMVLGMAFLRNTYTLINYGDFIAGSNQTSNPYIQFLATTDPKEAHTDFVTVRLNGIDTTGNTAIFKKQGIRPVVYYIIITTVGVGVIAAVGFFFIYRSRRKRRLLAAQEASTPTMPDRPNPIFPTQQMQYFPPVSNPPIYVAQSVSYSTPTPIPQAYHPHIGQAPT